MQEKGGWWGFERKREERTRRERSI